MDVYGVKVKPTDIGAFGGPIVDIGGWPSKPGHHRDTMMAKEATGAGKKKTEKAERAVKPDAGEDDGVESLSIFCPEGLNASVVGGAEGYSMAHAAIHSMPLSQSLLEEMDRPW